MLSPIIDIILIIIIYIIVIIIINIITIIIIIIITIIIIIIVPQGTVLGPIPFLIYSYNMPQAVDKEVICIYLSPTQK